MHLKNTKGEKMPKGDADEQAGKLQRGQRKNQSQRTSYMSKSSQAVAFYHELIFDEATPTYLKRFNLFGLSAFGVLILMMTILFALLAQLFMRAFVAHKNKNHARETFLFGFPNR